MSQFTERQFRAPYLMQWNASMSKDDTTERVDKVVEAVLHHQNIPFEHTSEYRSVYSYDKLWEQLEHYAPRPGSSTRDGCFCSGVKFAFQAFSRPSSMEPFEPVKLMGAASEILKRLALRDTSSGLTAYGESKFHAFTVGLDKAISVLVDGKAPAPALAGTRTQRKGKTRLVWNIPLEMIIIEATVARPIIDHFKTQECVMTFGDTSHEVGARIRRCTALYKNYVSIDYSQFDASVRADLIHAAFAAMRTWYRPQDCIYGNVTVAQVFDLVERYFITTPIVMPKSGAKLPVLITGKDRGVPSGSYFTQVVDSFANAALIGAASRRFKLGVGTDNLFVLGDDCLFFTNADVSHILQQLEGFLARYGFKTNPAKGGCGVSTAEIEFLGRRWHNGFPVRSWPEVVRGAIYPERHRYHGDTLVRKEESALNLINSYQLTSYVEDAPVEFMRVRRKQIIPSKLDSGYTRYLLSEGFIPGQTLKRAIF